MKLLIDVFFPYVSKCFTADDEAICDATSFVYIGNDVDAFFLIYLDDKTTDDDIFSNYDGNIVLWMMKLQKMLLCFIYDCNVVDEESLLWKKYDFGQYNLKM